MLIKEIKNPNAVLELHQTVYSGRTFNPLDERALCIKILTNKPFVGIRK